MAGDADKSLGMMFRKIVRRAGGKGSPNPVQNCRTSRQLELEQHFLTYVVGSWLGNTTTVAHEHYLTVIDEQYAEGIRSGDQRGMPHPVLARAMRMKKPAALRTSGETAMFSEVVAITEDSVK